MRKEEIERPEPGTLAPRISFIEQMGGSAGYYVRFKDLPEEEGGPLRKYIPILQYESQEKALQAAIEYRDQKAKELGLPTEPERLPHPEEAKEKMSEAHNRTGLRGLGLSFTRRDGTVYPTLQALWSEERGQQQVRRGMATRGLHGTMEKLAPYLKEHLHPGASEEELVRRGAEGTARLLLRIAGSEETDSSKRDRIEALLRRWAERYKRDRMLLRDLAGQKSGLAELLSELGLPQPARGEEP